jgi:hypothetical protein
MRRKIISSIFFSIFLGPLAIIIDSCLGSRCKCQNVPSYYKIEKIALDVRSHAPSSTVYKIVVDSGKLPQNDFTLFLSFQYSYYSSNQKSSATFSIIHTASACKCLYPGHLGSTTKLNNIYFTTVNDYNSTYTAGDTLNSLIRLNGKTVEDFILDWNNTQNAQNITEINLSQPPEVELWQQINVFVNYGSDQHSAKSVVFRLTP